MPSFVLSVLKMLELSCGPKPTSALPLVVELSGGTSTNTAVQLLGTSCGREYWGQTERLRGTLYPANETCLVLLYTEHLVSPTTKRMASTARTFDAPNSIVHRCPLPSVLGVWTVTDTNKSVLQEFRLDKAPLSRLKRWDTHLPVSINAAKDWPVIVILA